MTDWTEQDISSICELDFPVRCSHCDGELTGLGESGRCGDCGEPFDRRGRLWETYGPEAFAAPPMTDAEVEASRNDSTAALVVVVLLACVVAVPICAGFTAVLFGRKELGWWIVTWFVLASTLTWLVVARRRERSDGAGDGDDAEPPRL